ncbi:hypothetical protein CEXT_35741 [Caerostris extrusa]|uniref:Uncharacterized protein n=1 Tax=Caerostris extrusa TaxID=172846 RepID=A0AAV4P0R7_CAEEX|nr:hypothetical protein CEXT_35741 [Caerostris extrusa]
MGPPSDWRKANCARSNLNVIGGDFLKAKRHPFPRHSEKIRSTHWKRALPFSSIQFVPKGRIPIHGRRRDQPTRKWRTNARNAGQLIRGPGKICQKFNKGLGNKCNNPIPPDHPSVPSFFFLFPSRRNVA